MNMNEIGFDSFDFSDFESLVLYFELFQKEKKTWLKLAQKEFTHLF